MINLDDQLETTAKNAATPLDQTSCSGALMITGTADRSDRPPESGVTYRPLVLVSASGV
jgi:hypothetical protein